MITKDSFNSVGYSFIFNILLQGVDHALSDSAGMLSTSADSAMFSAFNAASTISRRIG